MAEITIHYRGDGGATVHTEEPRATFSVDVGDAGNTGYPLDLSGPVEHDSAFADDGGWQERPMLRVGIDALFDVDRGTLIRALTTMALAGCAELWPSTYGPGKEGVSVELATAARESEGEN